MIFEAELIGLKEGIKLCIVWLVFYSYLLSIDRKPLIKPFYAGLVDVLLLSLLSFFLPEGILVKKHVSNIISMSLAVFLLLSGASLYHSSGVNLFGKGKFFKSGPASAGLVFLLTLLFFLPDSVGVMFFFKELAFIKETELMTYLSAALGLLVAFVIFFAFVRLYKPYKIGSFFDRSELPAGDHYYAVVFDNTEKRSQPIRVSVKVRDANK